MPAARPVISLADHEAAIAGLDHHEGAVDDQTTRNDAEQPGTKRLLRERGQCSAQSARLIRSRVNGGHEQETADDGEGDPTRAETNPPARSDAWRAWRPISWVDCSIDFMDCALRHWFDPSNRGDHDPGGQDSVTEADS